MTKKSFIIMIILILLLSGCGKRNTDIPNGMELYTDAPKGYSICLPENMTFDYTLAESYTKCENSDMAVFISRETSPYKDVLFYIDRYIDRYITSPDYQSKNNISLNCHTYMDIGNKKVKLLSVTRKPYDGSEVEFNTYSYAYFFSSDSDVFHRIMIKSKKYDFDSILSILNTFKEIPVSGDAVNDIDTTLVEPDWNEETKAFYHSLQSRNDVMWGIFIPNAVTDKGMNGEISNLEEKLEYKFPLCMQYSHLPHDLPPQKGLNDAYKDGKITELTLQIATLWNNDLENSVNPNFQVIDGVLDDDIRSYAKAVKEFGHPVIMRINNEMNTDWTSYCGVQLMEDPEIFRMVYNRIYDIFQEEGANNTIWQFNPQYGNFPPANFNDYMAYFPGNDKVQVLGLTSYNTGNYYQDVDGFDNWQSFSDMYNKLHELYIKNFSDWPWIIGEFSSASNGGIKENWITNMFNSIHNYPNIKAAIWLNWEAYDSRKGSFGTVSNCYRLEETPETLKAFKDGLHGIQTNEVLPEL